MNILGFLFLAMVWPATRAIFYGMEWNRMTRQNQAVVYIRLAYGVRTRNYKSQLGTLLSRTFVLTSAVMIGSVSIELK